MLSVICWKWTPRHGYRSTFGPATVNTLAAMVRRHYPHPHRFLCVTEAPEGIDASVEILPAWNDWADVPSPHGGHNPSCYRRLRLFHPDAAQWFGERFVSLDLDAVITGDLTPLWHRREDFVIWGDTNRKTAYNGSMVLMAAGSRPQVWNDFDPIGSPQLSKSSGCFGSDQGWISYRLGKGEAKWSRADGVYSFRNELLASKVGVRAKRGLPADARIVFFHGKHDPWHADVQRAHPWIREHYKAEPQAVVC
jgi:hypothetical protein